MPVIMPFLNHRDSPKCPDCGAEIQPDVVLCINCGLNLKTGEKTRVAYEDITRPRRFPIRMAVIPAIAFMVLCVLAFVGWRLIISSNKSSKSSADPRLAGRLADISDQQIIPKESQQSIPPATPLPEPVESASAPKATADKPVIEQDTRALQSVIANVASISNYASARDTLRTSIAKYPRAGNIKEAEMLLQRLQQAVNVDNAIFTCTLTSNPDAVRMLNETVARNSMAPNLAQAQALLSKLRQEQKDTDAMAVVLENARTNANRRYAIRMLKDASTRYPLAANLDIAAHLLTSYQQASSNVRISAGTSPSPLVPTPLTSIMDNIAIIMTKDGAGTGFVLTIGGKKYIVTNRHVIEGAEAQDICFEFISGETPVIKGFEIAQERDLVRFEIENSFICSGLSLAPIPDKLIGDDIIVYGNSKGVGAITELHGKITAWGPAVIETSAEFVGGNSGSPIVDANSNIVAVATFATRGNPEDWVAKGTRFAQVRRFGVRVDNAEWQQVNLAEFIRQGKLLNEAYMYLLDLFDIYICVCLKNPSSLAQKTYSYYTRPDGAAAKRTRWSKEIITIVQYYAQQLQGRATGNTTQRKKVQNSSSEAGYQLCKQKLKSAPLAPKQILKNTRWVDRYYSDWANKLMEDSDWMYSHFQQLN